jgi:PAS domain S-box-containing protein
LIAADFFDSRIQSALRQVAGLEALAHRHSDDIHLQDSIRELNSSLESLKAAAEELSRQTQVLADTQLALDLEKATVRELFEAAPVGFITTTLSGVITDANSAAASLLRSAPEALIGRPLAAFISPPDRRRVRDKVLEILENPGIGEWRTRVLPKDARIPVPVGITAHPVGFSAPEGPGGIRWVVRDLTELRRAQAHARQLDETMWARVAQRTAVLTHENGILRARLDPRRQSDPMNSPYRPN